MIGTGLTRKINIVCLLAAIAAVLVLPRNKEIWYDETVSILCSKGISHDTHLMFANATTVNSATIELLNTPGNVANATVLDNGNSFVYNISLHYFTLIFGNGIPVYMLFSKLCGIGVLLAFFTLCRLLFRDSIFAGVAIILLAVDINFIGMSHEIRAYEMGTFFITLAAVYFYKFMYENERPMYLFLLGLFSVGAVLSHFLSLYVILVFLGYLVVVKKARLFRWRNICAMLVPVILAGAYFYYAYIGLSYMSNQNQKIYEKTAAIPFSAVHVLYRSIAMFAIDFKSVFPAFGEKKIAVAMAFLTVVALYISALFSADNREEKRNLNLLLILGASGSIFLALLCFKSRHYVALYNRYHSFCIPFACLFTAYALYLLFKAPRMNKFVKAGAISVIVLPACALFFIAASKINTIVDYNHVAVAKEIVHDNITRIEVPDWDDALLVQAVLPKGCKIDYVLNAASPYFALYRDSAVEKVPVIRKNQ